MDIKDLSYIVEISGAVMPLAILMVDSDEDRAFLSDVYITYRKLMFKTARGYFGQKTEDVEDAVSESVERMCRYCRTFSQADCNKRAAYVVRLVENVCRTRYRREREQSSIRDDLIGQDDLEKMPAGSDVHGLVFERIQDDDWLDSFERLSQREKDIFCMRHVDLMDYEDMAQALGMEEGAVRTALSRVKKKIEKLAAQREGEACDE